MLYQKIWQKWSTKWLWLFMPVSCWSTCLENHEELQFQHTSAWIWPVSVHNCNIEKQIKSSSKVHKHCRPQNLTFIINFTSIIFLRLFRCISFRTFCDRRQVLKNCPKVIIGIFFMTSKHQTTYCVFLNFFHIFFLSVWAVEKENKLFIGLQRRSYVLIISCLI